MLTPKKTNRTPVIVGASIGSTVFVLVLLALLIWYRRYRARKRVVLLQQEHEQYRSSPPMFSSFYSDERRGSNGSSTSWSTTSAKEKPTHANISTALSLRAAATGLLHSKEIPVSIPTYPHNSLSPKRSLHVAMTDSKPPLDRQRDVEKAIARLQGKMSKLQSNTDRNTVEGIEDEAAIILLKMEMERLKRLLDSEWAKGLTDEPPHGLYYS
ncbi:hypothetical protein GYMLUDRAFT_924869 [Collybiopsis luxurians FD-317 M1]|uniref:Uncharacterized protein n=1 Tax=Collybiopsis luxurians FD-317 M1 TaxID=944289 RepID=A0A0D0C7J3_9AGAR|nr:hypothetical protein GYMLUDRAFT_924869 [Collybiopsis luxurians FD-317 M1]